MFIKFDDAFLDLYQSKHSKILYWLKNKHNINAPSKEIEIIFQILKVSKIRSVRDQALSILINLVRFRNTNLAIPERYLKLLTDPEKNMITAFINNLNKLENRSLIAKYPSYWFETEDIKSFARAYIKSRVTTPINKESKVLTFGSCFAVNIAAHLSMLGYNAKSIELGELANNTYTNLRVLEYVVGEVIISNEAKLLQPLKATIVENLADELSSSSHVIFTLGLSMAFYSNINNTPL